MASKSTAEQAGAATIHLRVPAATKARWVRESRAARMRLTDWIIQRVEPPVTSKSVRIVIPDNLPFSALKLSRSTLTGELEFDWSPIERICAASGLDIALLRDQDEGNVAGLLVGWYRAHRASGGYPNAVMDDLIAEAEIEDTHGGGLSHKPGRA